MSCTIINAAKVKLNGGTSAYGGIMSKVTLNFGLLNSATTASVTLVQNGDTALSTPQRGDNFSLDIMGMNLNFRIKGYQMQDSASGATQLTVNLSDMSHVFLDQNFIALKEEWPNYQVNDNVDVIGTKMGTLPMSLLIEAGFISPDSDSRWGGLRAHFKAIQLKLAAGLVANPQGIQLSDADVEYHVSQSTGKTIWGTNVDPVASSDLAGSEKGVTLKEVIKDVIQGDLPDGTFDFSGSYREVLIQIANTIGKVAYWDAETNKAVIEDSINSSLGMSKLDQIASSCEVISSSESADFSTAMAIGAVGSFASTYPGESQETQGGKMSRYYKASLLNPTFYYTPCRDTGDAAKMLEIDLSDNDTLKAMSASHHDDVYAMYVLQTVLSKQDDAWDAGPTSPEAVLAGRQNWIANVVTDWEDQTEKDPFVGRFVPNELLASFYEADTNLEEYTCVGNLYPMRLKAGTNLSGAINKLAKGWNKDQDKPPCSVGGPWDGDQGKEGISFINGTMFFRPPGSLQSILGDSGFDSGTDIFQKYLAAISSFYQRYYVIKEQTGLRSIYDKRGRDYGFYISGENSSGAMNWKNDGGYKHVPVNPYVCVADCGIDEIKNLFLALSSMCNAGDTCMEETMQGVSVLDFISVLSRNNIKNFFSNPAGFKLSTTLQTADDIANENTPNFQMHLIVKEEADFKSVFASSTVVCWDVSKGIQSKETPAEVVAVAEKVTVLSLEQSKGVGEDTNILNSIEDSKIWLIGWNDIGDYLSPIVLPKGSPSSLKSWYQVDGSTGTITYGPGQFFISGAKVPAKSDDVWTASLNFGVSINAADVGLQNDIFAKWSATAAEEGSPYSFNNQILMSSALGKKISNSTWVDTSAAASRSVSVILGENSAALTLPSVADGLESLSISTSGGKLEITMTVGNSLERQAKAAMFKLMSSNSHLQHVSNTIVPDTFISTASPRFVQLAQGRG